MDKYDLMQQLRISLVEVKTLNEAYEKTTGQTFDGFTEIESLLHRAYVELVLRDNETEAKNVLSKLSKHKNFTIAPTYKEDLNKIYM